MKLPKIFPKIPYVFLSPSWHTHIHKQKKTINLRKKINQSEEFIIFHYYARKPCTSTQITALIQRTQRIIEFFFVRTLEKNIVLRHAMRCEKNVKCVNYAHVLYHHAAIAFRKAKINI